MFNQEEGPKTATQVFEKDKGHWPSKSAFMVLPDQGFHDQGNPSLFSK